MTKERDIREGVVNAFHSFMSESMDWRAEIDGLVFASLSEEEANSLEVAFREEEVLIVLHELNGDKSRGSDGYSIAFW